MRAMDWEVIENAFARRKRSGEHFEAGMERIGIPMFAKPEYATNTVTAFVVPGCDAGAFQAKLRELSAVETVLGQSEYADTLGRVGTMGWVDTLEHNATLEAIEGVAFQKIRRVTY